MSDFTKQVFGPKTPGVHSKKTAPARCGEGGMPLGQMARPGTMLAAQTALVSGGDFTRAKIVGELLEGSRGF